MSAAARAQARKKAILSRGTDRLSKLTASARGDDAPQLAHADPLPPYSSPRGSLANFIGEDPPIPDQQSRRPPAPQASPFFDTTGLASSPPGPSAWPNEQRHQFLQALLGSAPPNEPHLAGINAPGLPGAETEDPLLSLISSLGVEGVFQGAGGVPQPQTEGEKPKTLVQKLLPLLHLIAVWALVAFFIFWREPESFRTRHSAVVTSGDVWNRWARLASGPTKQSSWSIEPVPFFWAFVSLELALYSMRIFFGFDSTRLPMLLSLALPHLPKPLPSILLYCSKYLQLAGIFADDLAAVVVAIGLFVVASSFYEN